MTIYLYEGDSVTLPLTLTYQGMLGDLTGATALMAIKTQWQAEQDDPTDSMAVLQASTGVLPGDVDRLEFNFDVTCPRGGYQIGFRVIYPDGSTTTLELLDGDNRVQVIRSKVQRTTLP